MIRFEDGVFFLQRVEEAAPVVVVTVLDDHESVPRQLRSSLLFCNSISRFFFFFRSLSSSRAEANSFFHR